MKTFDELKKQLSELIVGNNAEIKKCDDNIQIAEKAIEKAEADITSAESLVDPKKYSQAKDDLWIAQHTKELYVKRKNKLETTSLITDEEKHQIDSEIQAIADNMNSAQFKRAAKLAEELESIAAESNKMADDYGQLYKLLLTDVCKQPKGIWSQGGKEYRGNTVRGCYHNIKNNPSYDIILQGNQN